MNHLGKGYINVDEECWWRNVLATTWRCWWRFWPFSSPKSSAEAFVIGSIFENWRRALSMIVYHSLDVTNNKILSPKPKICHQHEVINMYIASGNCSHSYIHIANWNHSFKNFYGFLVFWPNKYQKKLIVLEGTFYIQLKWARLSHHRLYVQSAVLLSMNSFENVKLFKMNKNVQHNLANCQFETGHSIELALEKINKYKILFLSKLWFLSILFLFCFDLLSIFPTLIHFVL